nr:unnamed protein product [Digitaria exilis]
MHLQAAAASPSRHPAETEDCMRAAPARLESVQVFCRFQKMNESWGREKERSSPAFQRISDSKSPKPEASGEIRCAAFANLLANNTINMCSHARTHCTQGWTGRRDDAELLTGQRRRHGFGFTAHTPAHQSVPVSLQLPLHCTCEPRVSLPYGQNNAGHCDAQPCLPLPWTARTKSGTRSPFRFRIDMHECPLPALFRFRGYQASSDLGHLNTVLMLSPPPLSAHAALFRKAKDSEPAPPGQSSTASKGASTRPTGMEMRAANLALTGVPARFAIVHCTTWIGFFWASKVDRRFSSLSEEPLSLLQSDGQPKATRRAGARTRIAGLRPGARNQLVQPAPGGPS